MTDTPNTAPRPGYSTMSKCPDVEGRDLSNAPPTYERIWLQSDNGDGATWCQHRQNDEDVPYVRMDFYEARILSAFEAPPADELARLTARLSGARRKAVALMDMFDMRGANRTTMQRIVDTCDAASAELARLNAEVEALRDVLDGRSDVDKSRDQRMRRMEDALRDCKIERDAAVAASYAASTRAAKAKHDAAIARAECLTLTGPTLTQVREALKTIVVASTCASSRAQARAALALLNAGPK